MGTRASYDDEFFDRDFDERFLGEELDGRPRRRPGAAEGGDYEIRVRRAPSPGIAAVLSVFVPGLGHVYSGHLLAGALWFGATTVAYSAVLLPGFLVHAFCIWFAYRSC